jgi:hypothetical protein
MIENEVSTICMAGPSSVNLDCWVLFGPLAMLPSSAIYNPGTVVTKASKYDWALGAMSILLSNVLASLLADALIHLFDDATYEPCECAGSHPTAPPGVDRSTVDSNVDEAMAMRDRPMAERLTWFWAKVQTGGDWDYKKYGDEYEDFGNWNFGVVGRALGLPEDFLLRGAGAFQQLSGTSRPEFGDPWDEPPSAYGDDPRDQQQIKDGVKHFLCCG